MLAYHSGLAGPSRLVEVARRPAAVRPFEMALLAGCGLLAAAAVLLLDFNLRIPGHAILRSVVPMSFGLALVPRRGAGLVMSLAAGGGLLAAGLGGLGAGLGASTSLVLTGPLLDLASRQAHRGWRLAVAFGLASLTSNLLALAVRAAARSTGRGGRAGWWSVAPVSYALCGLLAGILCAVIWFRWRGPAGARSDRAAA
jgi:hypothetical protein